MKIKIVLLALLTLMLAFPYKATACETLSLDGAVGLALSNNKDIKQSQEEKKAAMARVIQARAGFFPSITASGMYIFTHQVPHISLPANSFAPNIPPKPVNTKLDFTFVYTAGFRAVWPIFSGGIIWHNYRASKYMYGAGVEALEAEKQNVVYRVKKAYYNLLLASESVNVLKHSIKLASEHLRVTKDKYRAGEVSELDVLNANVNFSNLQPQFIGAKNNIKIAELMLKNILGVNFTDDVCANPSVVMPKFSNSLTYYQTMAAHRNYQLKILDKRISAVNDYRKMSLGKFLPSLALAGNYNWITNNFSGRWQDIYQAELILSVPLFNGGASVGRVKEAYSNYYRLLFLKSETKNNIKISIEAAYSGMIVAQNEIKSAQNALNTAQKAENIAEEQYRIGMATNLDVLNANLAYKEAQMNYIKAKYNYLLTIAKLQLLTGKDIY